MLFSFVLNNYVARKQEVVGSRRIRHVNSGARVERIRAHGNRGFAMRRKSYPELNKNATATLHATVMEIPDADRVD